METQTIEALAVKHGIRIAVLEGTKRANSWKTGKEVTEEEFLTAVTAFGKAAMDGRKEDTHVQ